MGCKMPWWAGSENPPPDKDKIIADLRAELSSLQMENTSLKEERANRWCPDKCPITGRGFFMWIEHPDKGLVPTYGGPFDSYTIAEPDADGTFFCERYDHDLGGWLVDETVGIGLRLIDDQREDHEYGTVDTLTQQLSAANSRVERMLGALQLAHAHMRVHIPQYAPNWNVFDTVTAALSYLTEATDTQEHQQ